MYATSSSKFASIVLNIAYRGVGEDDGSHGIGDGPVRAVLRQCLQDNVTSPLWSASSHGYFTIPVDGVGILSPEDSRSLAATGALAACSIHYLGWGPEPISPWVVLCAMVGDESAMDALSWDHILTLDPEANTYLKYWFGFTPDTVFARDDTSICLSSIKSLVGLYMPTVVCLLFSITSVVLSDERCSCRPLNSFKNAP